MGAPGRRRRPATTRGREQRLRRRRSRRPGSEDLAAERLPAGGRLRLAQLLERVDPDVRVRADADADSHRAAARRRTRLEVPLGRRADADARAVSARRSSSLSSAWVAWTTVVRGPRRPVRREARSAGCRAPRCTRRSRAAARRRGRGVAGAPARHRRRSPRASRAGRRGRSGGTTDSHAGVAQLLQLPEILGRRVLPEPLDAPSRVGAEQKDDLDLGLPGRLDRGVCLRKTEVVELTHRRVPGLELEVGLGILTAHCLRRLALGLRDHRLPPGPEVAARPAPRSAR